MNAISAAVACFGMLCLLMGTWSYVPKPINPTPTTTSFHNEYYDYHLFIVPNDSRLTGVTHHPDCSCHERNKSTKNGP